MKRKIMQLVAAFAILLFAGCGSSGDETPAIRFTGEWHLTQWNGTAPKDFDAYVVFHEDRTFVIYQQIERIGYQSFSGRWAYDGKLLSGIYDDETPWGSDYEVSLDETDDVLTLTSQTSIGEVSVYRRTTVPEEIKGSALPSTTSRSERPRLF